jgi:hypothetical protein
MNVIVVCPNKEATGWFVVYSMQVFYEDKSRVRTLLTNYLFRVLSKDLSVVEATVNIQS